MRSFILVIIIIASSIFTNIHYCHITINCFDVAPSALQPLLEPHACPRMMQKRSPPLFSSASTNLPQPLLLLNHMPIPLLALARVPIRLLALLEECLVSVCPSLRAAAVELLPQIFAPAQVTLSAARTTNALPRLALALACKPPYARPRVASLSLDIAPDLTICNAALLAAVVAFLARP